MINGMPMTSVSQLDKIYDLATARPAFTPQPPTPATLMEWIEYWLAQLAVIRQVPELLLAVCEGYPYRHASGSALGAFLGDSPMLTAYHIVIVKVHEQFMLQIGGWNETSTTR